MKNCLLLLVCMGFSLLGNAQTEGVSSNNRYTIVGVNFAPLLANQIQIDAEFGREQTTLSWMASVFYGQLGAYENRNGEVYASAQNYGFGVGLRMYETASIGTRFFVQPSLYYKSLSVNHNVMQFIPYTYDGLPAQRWGAALQTDEYRGIVAELIAGSQSFVGPFVIEGGIGFVYRNMSPLQQTQKTYAAEAEILLGLGHFSPLAQFKLGYKF